MAAKARMRILSLFGTTAFRYYILGIAISDIGTWMQTMAQNWVLSTLTNKAVMFGIVNLVAGIPMLVVTLLGGIASDRFDKRKILALAQIAQMLISIVLGYVIGIHSVYLWQIICGMALLGVCSAFQVPIIAALVPELVNREQIADAVILDRTIFYACRFVGPFIAGVLIERWGPAAPFFVNALSFVVLIGVLIFLLPRGRKAAPHQNRDIREGFHHIMKDPAMVCLFALVALTTFVIVPVVYVLLPLFVRDILGGGAREMGWIMGMAGIGAIAGSLGLLVLGPHGRLHVFYATIAATGVAVLTMSFTTSYIVTAASIGVLAAVLSVIFGLSNIVVQERAANEVRGRISAVFGLSFFALAPFAGLILSSLADLAGMRIVLVSSSIVYVLIAFGILIVSGQALLEGYVSPAVSSEFLIND